MGSVREEPYRGKVGSSLGALRPAGSSDLPGFVWVAVEPMYVAKILLSTSVRAVTAWIAGIYR